MRISYFLIVIEPLSDFFTIEQSHSRYIIDFGEFIFSKNVFWILPSWSVSNDKDVERKTMGFALLFKGRIKGSDILAIWAPVYPLFIGLTSEKHHAFSFFADDLVEDLFSVFVWHFDHFPDCRYLIRY